MEKKLLLLFLILVSGVVYSQQIKPKVFIEFNNESEGWLNEFLEKTENWIIVGTPNESNVVFRVQMSQNAYRAFGKLIIIDSQTGETLYTTPNLKGQSSAFNGYAPKKNLSKNLIDDVEKNFDKKKINLSHFGKNTQDGNKDSSSQNVENDKYDKLRKLKKLLDDGIITQEEYEREKKKILEEKDK
jgi:hypothetical protein